MALVTLKGAFGSYGVGDLLATTQTYRLYLCQEVRTGERFLMQVAATLESSGGLDRAAFLLNRLKATADTYSVEYTARNEGKHLHYDRLYPNVVDSFVSPEQGKRRINVLSLTDVDSILRVLPLSNLLVKDRLRIDPETSAWVMGRLLKLLAFVHEEGIAIQALTANNILLDIEQHFAVTLDWSNARMFPLTVPAQYAAIDIAYAAKAVFAAIGGSVINGTWSYEGHIPYVQLLRRFTQGKETNAERAMDTFYELVRREYGKTFHPFTTLPL